MELEVSDAVPAWRLIDHSSHFATASSASEVLRDALGPGCQPKICLTSTVLFNGQSRLPALHTLQGEIAAHIYVEFCQYAVRDWTTKVKTLKLLAT